MKGDHSHMNAATSSGSLTGPAAAAGPLVVSTENARYFTIAPGNSAQGQAVYLTGSHIWNNFQDGMGPGPDCAETPERFDFDGDLGFLTDHGHTFIRSRRG